MLCRPGGGCFAPGCVKDGLHPGLVRAGTDQIPIRPTAKDQVHRVHHDGFARAGFAGHDMQSIAEFQRKVLNQRNVMHLHG